MSAVWHPFTQHATEPVPPRIVGTEGAYLETADGRRLLDGISSWWVVTHGHRQAEIVAAIRDATGRMDQVIFAGLTHAPGEELAEALVGMAPKGLTRVFYSDSGSTAVEVALKMALGYWRYEGDGRHRIAVIEDSYHGDTIGTMSVGERGVFNAAYDPLMFAVDKLPFPTGDGAATLAAFEELAASGKMAALILEPLILGAGGMRMYSPQVLAELRAICDRHDVLMIADEVMTGWGRTGRLWACDHAGIAPDILCTSKGLTGGVVPLAATLASDRIFQAHYSTDRRRTFYHSSSYTANPIACAAALAQVRLWQQSPMQARLESLTAMQAARLARFAGDPRFHNLRQCGTIAAMDLQVGDAGYLAETGPRMRAHFLENGVLLRPLGNTVYVLPPYCVTDEDLDLAWGAVASFEV
ncbi:adenosylmethionine--8-amino-7-oxononanoate transaminase [Paracoccus sp. R12_1]|uniref:adenosylmethionine--8-amino-7-oxononanoate transaminase n=1 Tax=unclassified Paracoccus (in: a-proteobacteria) TaxID=2688777 RepID=UPI001ADB156E|nr:MULTISPECIES: adenosylmethionine--8-amino-7-oxononanoate transaminase [unclassified Paracoccus (in: a-proteobacteria)]MBO9454790.1 adenosylmethionine--8-amino-7-oxononanoate transaminase [Paracoccus sp. R12_2]MBO9485522.1 adenosylmethionine--8-amino-7-oxononanoate transaminase [Paracoccus sp. R12_1]